MQIICIGRGSYSKGKELAETLAENIGCQCVSREDMIEEAIKSGVAVGKLETAILKPHIFNERLAIEKELFQAFSTKYLLERAATNGGLVYHGRAGHLLLPGISHVLRVRVVADKEFRINDVMNRLNLNRAKAKSYIESVDEDIRRWVRMYYGVEWEEASQYDVILNLEQMHAWNAATALCALAELPEFQITPASRKAIADQLLAARARLALAEDESTYNARLAVRADNGTVSVVYQLQQAEAADKIPEVLKKLDGVKDVVCTMAQSNILWIQEKYDPESESFKNIFSLAQKWDSAVELLRLVPSEGNEQDETIQVTGAPDAAELKSGTGGGRKKGAYNGGIEDDDDEQVEREDDGGLNRTLTELARLGRSGGGRSVRTTPRRLVKAIDHSVEYNLLVVGDVFLSKGHAAQVRMAQEMCGLLNEKIKVPVVMADELKQQFFFGTRQLLNMLAYLTITAVIYFTVFTHQAQILEFLHDDNPTAKILSAGAVFVFVPVVAYVYGTASSLFLKLLRIE